MHMRGTPCIAEGGDVGVLSFHKSGDRWIEMGGDAPKASELSVQVILEQGINTPPRLYTVDRETGKKSLVLDLNPQLRSLRLGRVEEIAWTGNHGARYKGGLYLPSDFVSG